METWLEQLKSGDLVIVSGSSIGSLPSVEKVDRVTNTEIIIRSTKYRRNNGRQVGGSRWYTSWLQEATPEAIKKIKDESRHRKLQYDLRETKWLWLSLEALEEIAAIVARAKESEKTDD